MSREIKMVIIVRKDLRMSIGKCAAQVAHAAFLNLDHDTLDKKFIVMENEREWISTGSKVVVLGVDSENELFDITHKATAAGIKSMLVFDAGRTAFHNVATTTCASIGPCESNVIDTITGHLSLL